MSEAPRPRIICHMVSTLDGRIDGDALDAVTQDGAYETTAAHLLGDAWICGRTTMQQHFAEELPFVSASHVPAGPRPVHVAHHAASYAISVDTRGTLRWAEADLDGDHLVCIVSERAPADYLARLREQGISYVVAGDPSVDLPRAMELLAEHFGIRRLLLEGGGHINGAFLEAGLVDEVSLLLAPGIDGRRGLPTVFDGIGLGKTEATRLALTAVERLAGDTLWLRYGVVR